MEKILTEDTDESDENLLPSLVIGIDCYTDCGDDQLRNGHSCSTVKEKSSSTEFTMNDDKQSVFVSLAVVKRLTHSTAQIPGTVAPTLTTFVAIVMMKGLVIPEFLKN